MLKLLLIFAFLSVSIKTQTDSSEINPTKLAIISTATVGGFIYAYAIQNDM